MSGELRLSPRRNAGSRPATGDAIADLADDVIGVLDALGIEGACSPGTRFGGPVALQAAIVAPGEVR
jgi:pimeloyl-ACP methyl ester carboxylesterase